MFIPFKGKIIRARWEAITQMRVIVSPRSTVDSFQWWIGQSAKQYPLLQIDIPNEYEIGHPF